MSCRYTLLFLFLCGFAALSVSEISKTDLLEGTPWTIKLPTTKIDASAEIKWVHLSGDAVMHWKNGKLKKPYPGLTMEKDGSLKFESVSLKNTGKYKYMVSNTNGEEIAGVIEMNVYAKAPKPTVRSDCKDVVKLICDAGDRTDLTFSWYKDSKIIQDKKNSELVLSPEEVKDNKLYTCNVSNPVSSELSDRTTVSCTGTGTGTGAGAGGESSGPRKLFGFDFWIMVSILAGGGALLLLLICVLIICACRSCKQKKQQEQDEDELRLRVLQDQNGTARSKHTARGQPAPPIPQEDLSPPTPTQTQAQPKAQIRGRPPPPPEDDDENPPPLPRPRNKQHRKRHEEPYRPME